MSALAKPLIHPTAAGAKGDPVNIDTVRAISTVTTSGTQAPAEYLITFHFEAGVPSIEWSYASLATRDTSLANIKTLASNAIA